MSSSDPLTLFVCGDVMIGRGIDQALPHSCTPELYESYVRSARGYVALAERANGPIPRPIDYPYPWGEALAELRRRRLDARIINLETAVTTAATPADKGIHYRVHPRNVEVLRAAAIDCCVLANNHVLDWGRAGLLETLATLGRAGLEVAGAGSDLRSAGAPALLELEGGGRLLVFGFALGDSGVPPSWAAGPGRPGVNRLPGLDEASVERVAKLVRASKREGDRVIVSIHWGGNWGYAIPDEHRRFAHALIEGAEVDLIHGHSSHHAKAIEVHQDRLILYGCGDFINDYEGIRGHEHFRGELALMYFPTLERATGRLLELAMVPLLIRNFRLNRPSAPETEAIRAILDGECRRFGRAVTVRDDALILAPVCTANAARPRSG